MPKYQWLGVYDLDVPEIDGDHRIMLDLVNVTAKAVESGNKARRDKCIERLLDFSLSHFAREEMLLNGWGYGEIEKHRNYHRSMYEKSLENFERLKGDIEGSNLVELCHEALAYLVDDVIKGDMNLKSFMIERGLVVHMDESGE